jgi:hypothetical protein
MRRADIGRLSRAKALVLGRTIFVAFAFNLSAILFFSQTATPASAPDHNK